MRNVAGVNHECRTRFQRAYPCNAFLQRALGVRVGGLVETHMAVADLQKGEAFLLSGERFIDDAE